MKCSTVSIRMQDRRTTYFTYDSSLDLERESKQREREWMGTLVYENNNLVND